VNGRTLVWLWSVSGGGEWRGVAGTFGQAQQNAQACLQNGGRAAVVESALLVFNPSTMRREYARTGRRCTANRADGRVEWTRLAWTTAEPA
jgi:hypothetical protein